MTTSHLPTMAAAGGAELATGEAGCPPRGSSLCVLPRPRPRAPGSSSVQQGRHGPPGESERGTNSARSCRGTQWRSSVRFACVVLRLSTIFFSLILKKKKIPSNVGVYVNSAFPFSHSLLSSTSSEGPHWPNREANHLPWSVISLIVSGSSLVKRSLPDCLRHQISLTVTADVIGVEGGGEMSMQIYLRAHRAWTWREV